MQYFDTFLQWFQEWKIFEFKTELLWPHTNKHSKSSKQKSNEGHNSNIFKQEKYKLFNGVTLIRISQKWLKLLQYKLSFYASDDVSKPF